MFKLFNWFFVFFVSVHCFLQANDLRVLPIINFTQYAKPSKRVFVATMMPLLQKNGIIFVEESPDLVLICGTARVGLCKKFSNKPIVILDSAEAASMQPHVRHCLKEPNVRAVFKNTVLRPGRNYNKPTVYCSYHFKLINDGCKKLVESQPSPLADQELQKVHCVLWDFFRSFLNADLETIKSEKIDFNAERPIDVFFAGSVISHSPRGMHRREAFKSLRAIKDNNLNIIIHEGRLPKDEFLALLKKSKIAVSPWGYGEWCWRDYEAIHSGAVLIKPDTSFVRAVPDLYQNDVYYVSCKADFSDLHEKITYVLNNYSRFIKMRKNAKRLLVSNWNYEKHAKNLADALRKIVTETHKVTHKN